MAKATEENGGVKYGEVQTNEDKKFEAFYERTVGKKVVTQAPATTEGEAGKVTAKIEYIINEYGGRNSVSRNGDVVTVTRHDENGAVKDKRSFLWSEFIKA